MQSLPEEMIIGTWRVVRSEIPTPYEAGKEFLHFTPEGIHHWEYPFLDQKRKISNFTFRMTEGGVHITPRNSEKGWELLLITEENFLVITGPHGHRSWLQRILESERPTYSALSLYFPPPSTTTQAEQGGAVNSASRLASP